MSRLSGVKLWYTMLMKEMEAAAVVAKVEAAGEKSAEKKGEEELQQLVQASQYCERRADVINGVQQ